ncbi:hypothetical protein COCNU_04G014950 [Cocos nucifera]|uniref:Uncharacterized protein n=1 Tax=Cocos nucifera TaxID=13894 RepID=A0A8K0I7R8_COCNU|nr:hypothetical protein COCNU_04G014950 [Cocos nucifera]
MLEITFAKWQLPDRTFLSADPTIRTVAGPPGLTVIVQVAWRHDCPEGCSFYFQGFARVHRMLTTGETDHRFLHFTAVPCPHSPRVHIKVDRALGGTAQDDDFESEWHGPCCVPLAGHDDALRYVEIRASGNDEERASEGENAAGAGGGAADNSAAAAAGGGAA